MPFRRHARYYEGLWDGCGALTSPEFARTARYPLPSRALRRPWKRACGHHPGSPKPGPGVAGVGMAPGTRRGSTSAARDRYDRGKAAPPHADIRRPASEQAVDIQGLAAVRAPGDSGFHQRPRPKKHRAPARTGRPIIHPNGLAASAITTLHDPSPCCFFSTTCLL